MSLDQDLEYSFYTKGFVVADRNGVQDPEDTDIANTSLDMLEQHQAKEQARLLQKFKELRQWQQQQQQQLMLQQHQQLKAWQDEQSKVQMLIATQGGAQWSKGLRPAVGGQKSPVMTPPSMQHLAGSSNIQTNSLQGSQMQGAGVSIDSGLAISMQDTMKSQGSLPKPVMYIDPSKSLYPDDEDKYTDSELFSNPGSHDDQMDILKGDNSRPAPDWMSDSSENFIPSKLPPPRPIRGGRNGGVNDQLAGLEHLLQTAPVGLLQQVLNLLPVKGRAGAATDYTDEVELSASPTLLKPGQQPRARKLQFNPPATDVHKSSAAVTSLPQGQQQQLQYPQQQQRQQQQHLQYPQQQQRQQQQQGQQLEDSDVKKLPVGSQKINLGPMVSEPEQDPHFIPRSVALTDDNMIDGNLSHELDVGNDDSNDEWENEEDEEEDESYDDQNITAKEVQDVPREDRPIQGIASKKSFEQLVEEQLRAEERKMEDQSITDKLQKKPFLKKGEGISRFNSAPRKPLKKVTKKPNQKPPPAPQANNLARVVAKTRLESEDGMQVLNTVDGSKKSSLTSGLKDGKKLAAAVKAGDKKVRIASKPVSSVQEALLDKSRPKLSLIHNAAQKRFSEQRYQQKEPSSLKSENNEIDLTNSGGLCENDRSPSLKSRSSRCGSDDPDMTELDSLAEFELLEDAVDNISFRSSSSLVQKLLNNDKRGQKEVLNKLKTISEIKKAGSDVPGGAGFDPSLVPAGDSDAVKKAAVNADSCNNANNNSNVSGKKSGSDSSEMTLTDSSDEENVEDKNGQFRNNGSSQRERVTAGDVSDSDLESQQSPSRALPRKVAPLASKFAAASDTLSLLRSLSQQASFLTSGQAPVAVSGNVNSSVTSRQGFLSTAAPSSPTAQQMFSDADMSRNHSSMHQAANYFTAPFHFPDGNAIASNCKGASEPDSITGLKLPSLPSYQTSWLETKPSMSHLSSSQFLADSARNFGSTGTSADVENAENPVREKSYKSSQYDESSADTDSEESDESDDDIDKADNVQHVVEKDSTNSARQVNSGDGKKPENGELQTDIISSTCFDDETSWVDEDDDADDVRENSCLKAIGPTTSMAPASTSTPPTSKLMSRLFPKLRPKPSAEAEKASQILQQEGAQTVPATNGLQSRILREKLMELDTEIERFRSENANLEILRKEREEGLAKLKQEIDTFQREKEAELKRLEEYRAEEMKKLKRERKLFDSYQKKIRSMPDKREREEIDTLRMQLQDLQDELRRKESRWNANTARLKNRLAELELENGELKEEVRILEKKRLEWMTAHSSQKNSVQSSGAGEHGTGKSGSNGRQASAPVVRSSTPTKESERSKAASYSGLKESNTTAGASTASLRPAMPSVTSANIGMGNKNGKTSASVNSFNTTQGSKHAPVVQTVVTAQTSKAASAAAAGKPATGHRSVSGEGLQNNPVPVMVENTLHVSAQVPAIPRSLASSANSSSKSAALLAMEQAVIDKGDISVFAETRHQDGKIEKTYKTGAKEIHFPNGTLKEISSDGLTIICRLANGDIRQIFPDHRVVYIFAEAEIMQETFPDGLETYQFKNGQVERRYPDGTVEITFPSKDVKFLFPDGGQEVHLTDGTLMLYSANGERIVEYPSGDKEIHTADYQRREFPDGIIKTVYSDGRHETRFPNGRVRLKDKAGNVILDQIVYR